jgi:hypothetical protein
MRILFTKLQQSIIKYFNEKIDLIFFDYSGICYNHSTENGNTILVGIGQGPYCKMGFLLYQWNEQWQVEQN